MIWERKVFSTCDHEPKNLFWCVIYGTKCCVWGDKSKLSYLSLVGLLSGPLQNQKIGPQCPQSIRYTQKLETLYFFEMI